MDLILRVSDEYLATIPGELHGMEHVTFSELQRLIDESGQVPVPVPGGSCSNMLRGLAAFGQKCAVIGKVGNDEFGSHYTRALGEHSVDGFLFPSNTPTSTVLSLVDPHGLRTMRTYLGASEELSPIELSPDIFEGVRLVHIEGYALYNIGPMKRTLELAKAAGCQISLDLAAFEVVRTFKEELKTILPDYIDVVFANEDETRELTGMGPEQGCDALGEIVPTTVVMVGKQGCHVRRDGEKIHYPAFLVEEPLDTTGAGDLFASGFLHSHLSGRSLHDCARVASLTGATIVQVLGAVVPKSLWPPLLQEVEGELEAS
jgi:sugar/nucleoside kinase (ribokinase family)